MFLVIVKNEARKKRFGVTVTVRQSKSGYTDQKLFDCAKTLKLKQFKT